VVFLIEASRDYSRAAQQRDRLGLQHVTFRPLFNGRNQRYFAQHVFVRAEDLVAPKPPLRSIYGNAVVNRGAFGRLVLASNGDYHASSYTTPLGSVSDCSLVEATARELAHSQAWKRTRRQVEPCRDCVFQDLCPPLSGYEVALGRNHPCHLWGAGRGRWVAIDGA
jgi:pseudo-rSAM protein